MQKWKSAARINNQSQNQYKRESQQDAAEPTNPCSSPCAEDKSQYSCLGTYLFRLCAIQKSLFRSNPRTMAIFDWLTLYPAPVRVFHTEYNLDTDLLMGFQMLSNTWVTGIQEADRANGKQGNQEIGTLTLSQCQIEQITYHKGTQAPIAPIPDWSCIPYPELNMISRMIRFLR